MVEIFDYLMAMAEGRVDRLQLDRCRENNNNMQEKEEEQEEEELNTNSVYDYEDYRYDYSDEEYSEENYDNKEDEEEALLVEANTVTAVHNTWNPLREVSKFSGGRNTPIAVEQLEDTRKKDWEAKQNIETESRVEAANGDATLPPEEEKSEKLSKQVKKSEYKTDKDDTWERRSKEKRKSPLPKDDFWEEDGGGFLDLGEGEKSEKWGQELFVRSSQTRFQPFVILISLILFKSCNN